MLSIPERFHLGGDVSLFIEAESIAQPSQHYGGEYGGNYGQTGQTAAGGQVSNYVENYGWSFGGDYGGNYGQSQGMQGWSSGYNYGTIGEYGGGSSNTGRFVVEEGKAPMDKGKAPMTPGCEKRLKQQQDRRQPELVLGGMRNNRSNQQPKPAPKSKAPPVVQQKKTRPPLGRMRTDFDIKKMIEETREERRLEVEHQKNVKRWNKLFRYICRKFPEVHKLYFQRHREMGEMDIPFGDSRRRYHAAKIDVECAALQAKLEGSQEARFWAEWGDVDNVTYQCRRVQMPTPIAFNIIRHFPTTPTAVLDFGRAVRVRLLRLVIPLIL
ncbi:hypothetical protein DCAR_0101282 [Daucus carota subsp. sativus]|uniref:Uncharacterized protein n=1 Tax=Daucus carota subsp. sativus TaxID=79200 RepID=A0AAF0W5Q3_DAUCS|nr:hypothetical protein DCAR_0101282 [Daucus carota subsp. sativus]